MGEQWLKKTIANGFSMLVLLKLKNAPKEDEIAHTMEAWFRVITYKKRFEQEIDEPRFNEAFIRLAQTCEWFPTPKELFEALPRRVVPESLTIERKVDPKMAERHIQRIKQMLRGVHVEIKPNKT